MVLQATIIPSCVQVFIHYQVLSPGVYNENQASQNNAEFEISILLKLVEKC